MKACLTKSVKENVKLFALVTKSKLGAELQTHVFIQDGTQLASWYIELDQRYDNVCTGSRPIRVFTIVFPAFFALLHTQGFALRKQ